MLSRFFIYRPKFAAVIAILMMALGVFALQKIPIEHMPNMDTPALGVSAGYRGASAETVEQSVTQILEQAVKGIEGLETFHSSSSVGRAQLTLQFEPGVDLDQAQLQVQNAVNGVLSRLPEETQQGGVNVYKSGYDQFALLSLYDESGQSSVIELSDYLMVHVEPRLSRIEGVGEIDLYGAGYAMRIWLNPHKLQQFNLMPSDIRNAIETQNAPLASGAIGGLPTMQDQYLNAKVSAGSHLSSVKEFENIIVKTTDSGSLLYLKDVARVELGAESYNHINYTNGQLSSALSITLAPRSNAIAVSKQIQDVLKNAQANLPPHYQLQMTMDKTPFITSSIEQVAKTLVEAIILVIVVMFIFLQNWRATIIPAVTIPIVVLATFAVLYVLGMTLNSFTLFALILAIGLLVDDAIVVVENIERLMQDEYLDAKAAALKSMQEMSGALVGITLVLTAVFIPMAFFGSITGMIYRQFSITLVVAMLLSLFVALVITPTFAAQLLKRKHHQTRWAQRFNHGMDQLNAGYQKVSARSMRLKFMMLALFGVCIMGFGWVYKHLPEGLMPTEDMGFVMGQIVMPGNAPRSEVEKVGREVQDYLMKHESERIQSVGVWYSGNNVGVGPYRGQLFVVLKDWAERKNPEDSVFAIVDRAQKHFANHANAQIFFMAPSMSSNGRVVDFWLQDLDYKGAELLQETFGQIEARAQGKSSIEFLQLDQPKESAELNIKLDAERVLKHSIPQQNVNSTLAAAWGGTYINDFIDRGQIKRVIMQGEAEYRSKPEDLAFWHVRNQKGEMLSFNQFSSLNWQGGPNSINRYMGYNAVPVYAGIPKDKFSSQTMQDVEALVDAQEGVNLAWSGAALEEKRSSGQAIFLYVISIAFIFLCLTALYESWTIPAAVISAIPLGVGGSILFCWVFGFANDIFFHIALLTTIGLSCKNAILIVEFAAQAEKAGKTAIAAALEGASLRLRPILMTSIAFAAGVIPLIFASGVSAISRQEIGASVLGGVIFATILVLFFIPFMYVLIRNLFRVKATNKVIQINQENEEYSL
ncbi:efflux RND transporter permease subunit [Acinetobacter sp. YH12043]|uniref:efflux RND transporter permease subunit n=1 Tax=Acinetobacter sp. YH12043 TaxID=2601050 RepID=UPI0015D2DED4|nr:efflux RND transporter permease subunit [Acinetobacter sp. YH12043]